MYIYIYDWIGNSFKDTWNLTLLHRIIVERNSPRLYRSINPCYLSLLISSFAIANLSMREGRAYSDLAITSTSPRYPETKHRRQRCPSQPTCLLLRITIFDILYHHYFRHEDEFFLSHVLPAF